MNTHNCNDECTKAYHYGYNCRLGCNSWKDSNPPWQESGFWGGGIEPDDVELLAIACRSSQYRKGWHDADKKISRCTFCGNDQFYGGVCTKCQRDTKGNFEGNAFSYG